jgi:isopentenyldiphosphate isomerase
MELFDLYTADREKTGRTMVRGGVHPEGLYRLVVHVCIFDSQGRMLIQQRQPFKKGWSNLWDISVGGCAIAGDDSRAAAERETREELGLAVDLTGERPSMTIYWERGFDDYYIVNRDVDLNTLHLQYEEVQRVKWATLQEILEMIDDGRFIPYEKSQIELLFFRRNHRSSHTRNDETNIRSE